MLTAGEGNEIYVRGGDSVAGMTLGELGAERPNAIVLGILKPRERGWDVRLGAPSDAPIEMADRVIMLARDYAETEASPKLPALSTITRGEPRKHQRKPAEQPRTILVLGWNRRVPSLIAEFGSYGDQQFHIDIVSVVSATERERDITRYIHEHHEVTCRHIEADYMVEDEMRKVRPADYDAVILLSSDRLASGEEADARAMVGYLLLEDLLAEGSRRPQLIMELSDPDNRHLLYGHQSEMLISPMILSHVLAQVALRRELRVVLDELFTCGGAELQFRDPQDYPLPASADFRLLEKALAAEGELALGVFRQQADERGRHLLMNPPRDTILELQPGDRLVVMAHT